MEITVLTSVVALFGLLIMGVLFGLQAVAAMWPKSDWVIDNVYGGQPDATDPAAYFAFNRGLALADVWTWAPLQFAASIGMLLGARWGFLLGLVASAPFWYSAVLLFVWDGELGFRQSRYWLLTWAVFPAFGLVQGLYCFLRLLT